MLKRSTGTASLTGAIEQALVRLADYSGSSQRALTVSESLPTLLEQCQALSDFAEMDQSDAVRTLHHFACTGGTIISKCVAAMPNTILLSEIDPLSQQHLKPHTNRFAPTDIISNLRWSMRPVNEATIEAVFLGSLLALQKALARQGRRLVIRDHAHSQFCTMVDASARSTLRELITSVLPNRPLVTVRHPLDSFLSLKLNGWNHFQPDTMEEYCRRYDNFLVRYDNIPIIRYEDFVSDPESVLRKICDILCLRFDAHALECIDTIKLSGNSGRSDDAIIEPRPRREVPAEVARQADDSLAYSSLCRKLAYDPGLT